MMGHILLALGLWIFIAGTMGWNRMFRGYCLESVAYFKNEVLPQLQNKSEWNDEAADLDDHAIPDTENWITDSSLIIVPLTCALAFNSVLLLFLSTDIPISGFLNGLVAFGNASAAVWISISRIRYFKVQAHVYACYTLLQAEEFQKKSLDELNKLEAEKNGEEK